MNRHFIFAGIGLIVAAVFVSISLGHNQAEAPLLVETGSSVVSEMSDEDTKEITTPTAMPDPQPLPIGSTTTLTACVVGGCGGRLCVEAGNEIITTCEWREAYACYQTATCERQPSGSCGWTSTQTLNQCLTAASRQDELSI